MTATTLTKMRARLLTKLASHDTASIEGLIHILWGDDPDGGPLDPHNALRVHVLFLRRFLARFGVTIENHRGEGYRIPTSEMRARAKEAIKVGTEERWGYASHNNNQITMATA